MKKGAILHLAAVIMLLSAGCGNVPSNPDTLPSTPNEISSSVLEISSSAPAVSSSAPAVSSSAPVKPKWLGGIETLNDEAILKLLQTPRKDLEDTYALPEAVFDPTLEKWPQGPSPVEGFQLVYEVSSQSYFQENADKQLPSYLLSRDTVFGVAPGAPLKEFEKVFGEIDLRQSYYWNNDTPSWFFMIHREGISFLFFSADSQEPVYTQMRVLWNHLPPKQPSENPYLNLVGREPGELTADDFKLLLTTPMEELEATFGLEPLEIPPADTGDYELFRLYNNYQILPLPNTNMRYQGIDRTLPPALIDHNSCYFKIHDIQIGCTFADIEAAWGPPEERRLYANAMGYWGRQWQAADYHRDGLVYSFRCMYPIMVEDYSPAFDVDSNKWQGDIPWEIFPQVVTRVVIALDDENYFYENL